MSTKPEMTIGLCVAIYLLQGAWMAVPANTTANCFRHASFVCSGDNNDGLSAAANEGAADDQAVVVMGRCS